MNATLDTCACGRTAVLTRPFGSTFYLPLCRQCAGGLWHEPSPIAPVEVPDAPVSPRCACPREPRLSAGDGVGMEELGRLQLWQTVERGLWWALGFLAVLVLLTAVGPTIDHTPLYEVGTTMARQIGGRK